ncbi:MULTISPECIES: GNAT family N-acetyltransferase [unclassified Jeotgalibaca]|uniref:GNAT family N-acetyltransferase n=1 Tax=unclassified Jeotgalibaca TaxID=2621505 RepID=UPI003FD37D65
MLKLTNLTEENLDAVLSLKMEAWQAGKLPTVAEEIAKAYVAPDIRIPLVINQREEVVGFMVFEFSKTGDSINLPYFMMAWQHQNKGFGTEALRRFIAYVDGLNHIQHIRCIIGTGDLIGRKTLESAGFMRGFTNIEKRENEMVFIVR